MLASHAVMQAFNSRFQGRDFVVDRLKGELKNIIGCVKVMWYVSPAFTDIHILCMYTCEPS